MTPEAQRIAIAEACRWKFERGQDDLEECWRFNGVAYASVLPDYLNDLNAMHEAEKVLPVLHQDDYVAKLADIVCHDDGAPVNGVEDLLPEDYWRVASATAAQRAEAFL